RLPERVETPAGAVVVDRVVDPEEWVTHLCRQLTETDSTFTRPQLVHAVAARIGEGATMATLERVVARAMASPVVIPVGDDGGRWSSTELLAVERRFLHTADTARASRAPVPLRFVDQVIEANPTLGSDQAAAVRSLTGTTDGVAVLVGPAGTGKTYTLDTIRAAYEAAGYRVQGAAPSARAAHELSVGAHISSSTIHRLLGSWSRGFDLPDARTLLVVDEAAMAGVRDLATVVTGTIRAGGRVLLVGDHRQLPEVTAGGGFAALAVDRRVAVSELTVNRRQHHRWEREALVELRDGHVAAAVSAYQAHGRIVVAEDPPAMLAAAVERWFDARGHRPLHRPTAAPPCGGVTKHAVTTAPSRCRVEDRGELGMPCSPPVRGSRSGTRVRSHVTASAKGPKGSSATRMRDPSVALELSTCVGGGSRWRPRR
ncbi:MAG: AAA family ATPase, partial [Acidimicrobiales bacterium]